MKMQHWMRLASLGLAAVWLAMPANAQSGYSMTVLSSPSGAFRYYPTALLSNDVVKGGMRYWTAYDWNIGYYCTPCSVYLDRETTWPASTAKTISATLGLKGFFPLLANDGGQLVGAYTLNASANRDGMRPSALWATRASQANGRKATHLMTSAGTTPVSLASRGGLPRFYANDINPVGWVVGDIDPGGRLYRNNAFETLTGLYPVAINRQGDVAGIVRMSDNYQLPVSEQTWSSYPVIWRNGLLASTGGQALRHHEPVDINVAGQVLLQEVQPDYPNHHTRAAVWDGANITTITGPAGQKVQAVDINDSGTVVGCQQKEGLLSLDNFIPFIWKNGVFQDLGAVLSSKGISPPAGMQWGCPTAINNKGSMLMYYFKPGTTNDVTWVRLTAKP